MRWLVSGSVRDYSSKKRSRKRKREVDSGVARLRQKDGESGKERSAWQMSRMGSGVGGSKDGGNNQG